MKRRTALKVTGAAVAGFGLPAASAQGGTSLQSNAKTLRYQFEVAESGFDPAQLSDLYSRIVTAHLFENLYCYDHLARPFLILPCTADGMPEVSADYKVWTVRIKPGIYFQDDPAFKGKKRELVAEDYVYSWKRFFDPRWKAPAYASLNELRMLGMDGLRQAALKGAKFDYDTAIEGMRALDRYTLRFRFSEPQPRFLQTMSGGDLWGALAREVVEAYGDDIPAHPVGTGPFRLAEWRRSSRIVLERNPTYREVLYDAQPNADDVDGQALLAKFKGQRLPIIDRVEIAIVEETQPRWLSFLNKQYDVMYLLPYEFVNVAVPNGKLAPNLARQGMQMYRALASDVGALTYFNMEDPVVGGYTPEKVALRRAIGLAIDVQQEIRLFWRGQAVPAQSPLVPNTFGYDPSFVSANGVYDLAQAKALLDMFGYVDRDGDGWREMPDGSPLQLEWATTPDQRARSRDELRRKDMNALGIRVRFNPAKWPENLKNARAGKLQVWNLGSSAAAPDGEPALYKGLTEHKGGQNLARFSLKKFDELGARIRVLPDGPERLQLIYEAKRILVAYMPYKYHVHRILTDLAWPWVQGFRRPPYWLAWWQYVDVDPSGRAKLDV